MKKFLLGSVALVALGAGAPANAADMPVRRLPPPAVFSWSGCYLGVNVGYAYGRSQQTSASNTATTNGPAGLGLTPISPAISEAPNGGALGAPITPRFNEGGIVGGGTAGCNYQFGVWVIGIEGDGGPTYKDGQEKDLAPFNPFFTSQTTERWVATARGRLGYAVDKWLFYVTGGAAWAGVEINVMNTTFQPTTPGGFPAAHDKRTLTGYTVGGGVEYALGYGWSIKSEFLYIDFRSNNNFFTPPTSFTPTASYFLPRTVSLDNYQFKWGLNYKFDWFGGKAAPVVTK
jgi:outer membrane immunogenic protein